MLFRSDWDVVMNICTVLQEMPGIHLQHVRGHQDRQIAYQRLSLLAQLNVEADRLANTYQRAHGAEQIHAPLIDGTGVHLVTPTGTVTSKYAGPIRYQATAGPLLRHIEEKYDWTRASISDSINWKAHETSIRKKIKLRTHYIKLVHDLLPMNHKQHRHDPARKDCPVSCNCRDETWAHILRCRHPSREGWRRQLYSKITSVCDKWQTKPELREILISGLRGWLECDDPSLFEVNDDLYDEEYNP